MPITDDVVRNAINLARGLPVESPAEALLVAIELLEMCAEKLGREEVRSELNRVLNDLWHASN